MVLDRQKYVRLQDGAEFSVKQEPDGTWSVYYYHGEGERVPVLRYFLNADIAEAILQRLAQVDIDAHAKFLFEYSPSGETAPDQQQDVPVKTKEKGRKGNG